jgi:hypothetical protein
MNNWCTLSPLVKSYSSNPAFSEGNLKSTCTASGQWVAGGPGTFGVKSGKWYWEWYCNTISAGNGGHIGIVGESDNRFWTAVQYSFQGSSQIAWQGVNAANKVNIDGSNVNYSDDTYETGDVCGVALDMDSGTPTVTFYLNGVTRGAINLSTSSLANETVFPSINSNYAVASVTFNFGQDSSFAGVKTAQGNQDSNGIGDFYYAPPAGHLALCSDNLSDPEIALPGDYHKAGIYTGDAASSRAITGVGFAPGFVFVKNTTDGSNGFEMDRVRGDGSNLKAFFTNDGEGEWVHATQLKTLDADGFTVGSGDVNGSGDEIVYYAFKTPTSTTSNGDGTLASDVCAETTSGTAIVGWTGNETNDATVGHGLGQAPDIIWVKDRNETRGYPTSTQNITGTSQQYVLRNSSTSATTSQYYFRAAPGASVFTLGNSAVVNDDSAMIAWVFHGVEGYSKFGAYTGANSADGNFIYCGFSPDIVIVKNMGATEQWSAYDSARKTYNLNDERLKPSDNDPQDTHGGVDMLSNGFKIRSANICAAQDYIFMAWANSPFKYSNAR